MPMVRVSNGGTAFLDKGKALFINATGTWSVESFTSSKTMSSQTDPSMIYRVADGITKVSCSSTNTSLNFRGCGMKNGVATDLGVHAGSYNFNVGSYDYVVVFTHAGAAVTVTYSVS